MSLPAAPADQEDQFPAYVRAYVPCGNGTAKPARRARLKAAPPSQWALVFDTETTVDPGQALRIGAFQLRKAGVLQDAGFFYEAANVTEAEIETLKRYAVGRGLKLLTRAEFVEEIFYGIAYERRATIVGFNLPFDLSRLAIRHSSARGKKMKRGFTFQLSENPRLARVQIRHLSSRAAFIQFAAPPRRLTSRGAAKRGLHTPVRRGSFIDAKTLAAALLGRSFSLESLSKFLKTPTQKSPSTEHGGCLTEGYLDYAMSDVQATWECYEALTNKFAEHRLTLTHPGKILSEASIGKAYLREMGIQSLLQMQPDIPPEILGITWSTYFGGRAEVRWRRTIKQVLYCDFLSMYPTVCTLMRLWSFITARGFDWIETKAQTQELLDRISLPDLLHPDTWPQLHTLVQLKPSEDILPLRTRYDGQSCTIGLNHVTTETPLWYTLADVIASKLLGHRIPKIDRALMFIPRAPQDGLRPIVVAGQLLDPRTDDLFKRIIDVRAEVKARWKKAPAEERERLNSDQLALKLLANSTSYGIFAEVNVIDLDAFETRPCFGPLEKPFEVQTKKAEEPGAFFNPLLATLITGGARLMLAMAESLAVEAGLDWTFCDTDSMAYAKPDGMTSDEFLAKAQQIACSFDRLNPYEKPGSLLKIEDANFALNDDGRLEPLHALCVSAKRYVLFNIAADRMPVIRKASAHGLGHLRPPYEEKDSPKSIPIPLVKLHDIGIERWQYDLWFKIICASLDGHSAEVDRSYHKGLTASAMSRYAATTPEILRWMAPYNSDKPYRDQVKPFGFLSAFQADAQRLTEVYEYSARRRSQSAKPIAPFNKDPKVAGGLSFDRETGASVPHELLRSYASALAQYHLSPEAKFKNGDFIDTGRTERRHVQVTAINHIGKESNKLEQQIFLGFDKTSELTYGTADDAVTDANLKDASQQLSERMLAQRLGISRMSLRKALHYGSNALAPSTKKKLSQL